MHGTLKVPLFCTVLCRQITILDEKKMCRGNKILHLLGYVGSFSMIMDDGWIESSLDEFDCAVVRRGYVSTYSTSPQ